MVTSTRRRWGDEDILEWAGMFTERSFSLMHFEKETGVSHSTAWWCFKNRLPQIDNKLYRQVIDCLKYNRYRKKYAYNN